MSEPSHPTPDVTQDVAQKYDSELASPPIQREVASVSAAELKAGATERAQQRPLLQKIVAVFKKEKGSYRELIINSEPLEKRVALLVDPTYLHSGMPPRSASPRPVMREPNTASASPESSGSRRSGSRSGAYCPSPCTRATMSKPFSMA